MTYSQTLSYLYQALPMFHRIGEKAIRPTLDNITELCTILDEPQKRFPCIHIAGTNGKGSTSHMLSAILQKSGYKTGLYTSPHLKDFRERIRIGARMIGKAQVVDFIAANKEHIERIKPSFFEMTVALAFSHFAAGEVDVAVIETGLGGRLDSTNIITPVLSVITNIGYDHMNLLGNSLEEIASEKAGIIKPGIPVVVGEKRPEIASVFEEKALSCKASLYFASEQFLEVGQRDTRNGQEIVLQNQGQPPETYQLDLRGRYQVKNLKTVLGACRVLSAAGFSLGGIKEGLAHVARLSGLRGRWMQMGRNPKIICDTGHNADGMKEVLAQLRSTPWENLHMVIGVVRDKDVSSMLVLMPAEGTYYFCRADIPRALEADQLRQQAAAYGLKGQSYASCREALDAARGAASRNDLIFIGGSTFVVGELIP